MKRDPKHRFDPDFDEFALWRPAPSWPRLGPATVGPLVGLPLFLLMLMSMLAFLSPALVGRAPALAGQTAPPRARPVPPSNRAWGLARGDHFTIVVPPELDAAMVVPVDPNLDAEMVIHRDADGRAAPAWPNDGPPRGMRPEWRAPRGRPRAPMPGPWRLVPPLIKPR